jgi:RNA binding exosome subunit
MSAVEVIASADTKVLQTSAQNKMIQNGHHGHPLKWLTEAISKGSEGVLFKDLLHTIDIKF